MVTDTRIERIALFGLPGAAAAYVALLAIAQWPRYWLWIAPEQTPMTWLESVLLVLCAAVCLLLAAAARFRGERAGFRWLVLAAGFGFLALDERFALHERLRDGYLAPRDIAPPFLPWVAAGDFLLLGYGVVALALLPVVLRGFAGHPRARGLLLAGAGLAALAVAGDSLNVHAMSQTMEIREQTAEEIVELAGCTCLLLAVWLRFLPVLAFSPAAGPQAHAGSLHEEPDAEIQQPPASVRTEPEPGNLTPADRTENG